MAFVQLMKHKDDFFNIFKVVIEDKGPHRNKNSVELRYLQSVYDTAIINEKVSTYLFEKYIRLYNSAPYKHQQNLAETFVKTIKDGL
jgi:hypothetical protein